MARRQAFRAVRQSRGLKRQLLSVSAGPLRVAIEAQDAALGLLGKREANAIRREALRRTGVDWTEHWLPRRFTPYARTLGYPHASVGRVPTRLQPQRTPVTGKILRGAPLVDTGQFAKDALDNNEVRAFFGANPRIVITIPTPHPITPYMRTIMQKIPAKEVDWLAGRLAKHMADLLTTGGGADG